MGDTAEDFKTMREEKQKRHSKWFDENTKEVEASGLEHRKTNYGHCIMLRLKGKPKVDFYPSTGRWRSEGRTYQGGAKAFLEWFEKQRRQDDGR